jgi:hypothetical protein
VIFLNNKDQLTSGINISRHGSTTRLINLISSLDPQDETDSSEDFNQQEPSAAEQENENNRSNEFHPSKYEMPKNMRNP